MQYIVTHPSKSAEEAGVRGGPHRKWWNVINIFRCAFKPSKKLARSTAALLKVAEFYLNTKGVLILRNTKVLNPEA